MLNLRRVLIALVGAMVSVVPAVEATSLSLAAPVPVSVGWTRTAGRYNSGAAMPTFQAVARCGPATADTHVLYGIVHLAPADGAVWIDLPGTPSRLVPSEIACETPELSIEMIVDTRVVAAAAIPRREPTATSVPAAALEQPPAPAAEPQRRLRLNGQKYGGHVGRRTEAGVVWSLDSRVSVQLNYARTAQVPMMPSANDNGILARLRVGF